MGANPALSPTTNSGKKTTYGDLVFKSLARRNQRLQNEQRAAEHKPAVVITIGARNITLQKNGHLISPGQFTGSKCASNCGAGACPDYPVDGNSPSQTAGTTQQRTCCETQRSARKSTLGCIHVTCAQFWNAMINQGVNLVIHLQNNETHSRHAMSMRAQFNWNNPLLTLRPSCKIQGVNMPIWINTSLPGSHCEICASTAKYHTAR